MPALGLLLILCTNKLPRIARRKRLEKLIDVTEETSVAGMKVHQLIRCQIVEYYQECYKGNVLSDARNMLKAGLTTISGMSVMGGQEMWHATVLLSIRLSSVTASLRRSVGKMAEDATYAIGR